MCRKRLCKRNGSDIVNQKAEKGNGFWPFDGHVVLIASQNKKRGHAPLVDVDVDKSHSEDPRAQKPKWEKAKKRFGEYGACYQMGRHDTTPPERPCISNDDAAPQPAPT
jgi:hypothetical protein